MRKAYAITIGVIVGIPILLAVILIPVSLKQVNYDELAIEYNTMTKTVNTDEVLQEGRHFIQPVSKLFKYTRTLQTIDLTGDNSIECLTNEGLVMQLGVETQYQIIVDKVFDLFEEFGDQENYTPYIESITHDAIRDVCANYSGEDFFFNRGDIDAALSTYLIHVYNESGAHATNELVQLTSVIHPDQYDSVSRSREAVGQENDRLLRERTENITEAQTRLLSAEVNAEITIIEANATRDARIAEAQALYNSEVNRWQKRADALVAIKAGIPGISNTEFINEYIKYYVLSHDRGHPIIQL
jgi:regulator of protease activity HflC (stomatin/prohibitin superfamily)